MPTGLDYMMSVPATAIGKGKVGAPAEKPGNMGVKVTAAIFFDGTGNNQSNIKKRLKDSSYMVPKWYDAREWPQRALGHFESYEQYYSNVAILYFMHKKKIAGERIASVYMEGIGTSTDGPDDTTGGGFGAGPTGIVDRVTLGITRLTERISGLYFTRKKEYLEEVTVYVFGFSRGAAAARHFCARRADSRGRKNNLCQSLGVDPAIVTIKFVGLFDTVSSFDEMADLEEHRAELPLLGKFSLGKFSDLGVGGRLATHKFSDKRFGDDVPELHLNFDKDPKILNVMQLAAADEYRVNFSSTTISSAVRQGKTKGFEMRLPGAHSDIGGGYANGPEEREFSDNPRGFQFFRRAGWFAPTHLHDEVRVMAKTERVYYLITTKRVLTNHYQYVALSIMLQLSLASGSGFQFGNPNKEDAERLPGEAERNIRYVILPSNQLFAIKNQLEQATLAQYNSGQQLQTPASPQPLPPFHPLPELTYQWLRQHYLHLSWSDRTGFEYRVDANQQPTRLIIAG